jgi:hypothetical protein
MKFKDNFLEIYIYVQFLAINFWVGEVMDFELSPIEKILFSRNHVIFLILTIEFFA